ncbi:alanine/glycine:cation symporter family protein [Psychroserpens sp.]|uniref:alanine/glycine:cation symporter family protein n=1 Tax=Psychroserpens sp. TaxID=2020870 RepID=UPI001B0644F6|nr:alanine/glycine:cation symporter family protein [Psychroserpens sp.]MBO6607348.1 alanine:cation symporter family protein [Psychroserpens sp.]MBO6654576.1 alanine:cation symporter family protein [Psychroserpens sp.]MBO6681077.1 alanine:cation symporter family protein [Psychroserpens sp.]MBO6749968.1 alanine:cation symporter family protein [Psychroserpens sp.]MBO6916046.1 alanine:cation symporter family protein [Psychroserpens sp.]
MEQLENFSEQFSSFAWGIPLLILLVGGGLYLLILSRFLPFRYFSHAISVLRGKYDDPNDPGEISHFKALTTALSSTIGMGNIAGVALAISVGGPGAMFWMWISAIVGMSTKYFTSTLAILYRGKDSSGQLQGGPMYFIREGLGKRWKPLAIMFSVFGMLGALPVVNVNQLKQAINDIILIPNGVEVDLYTNILIAIILVIITSIVIMGGLKRISNVASKMVPSMVLLYFVLVLIILAVNYDQVPHYFVLIITDAFDANYISGDEVMGGMLGALILLGIKRGAFSNEAGIGTAPMAHGAAKTDEPVREGLVAMLGPVIDTLIVCTLTALAILVTGVWETTAKNGVSLTASAFQEAMPYGQYLLMVCVFIFSISSLFSYAYYGKKCLSFLIGAQNKHYYNIFYIGSIVIAATTEFEVMINFIDGIFAFMAIPTMLATILLAPKVVKETKSYFNRLRP